MVYKWRYKNLHCSNFYYLLCLIFQALNFTVFVNFKGFCAIVNLDISHQSNILERRQFEKYSFVKDTYIFKAFFILFEYRSAFFKQT